MLAVLLGSVAAVLVAVVVVVVAGAAPALDAHELDDWPRRSPQGVDGRAGGGQRG